MAAGKLSTLGSPGPNVESSHRRAGFAPAGPCRAGATPRFECAAKHDQPRDAVGHRAGGEDARLFSLILFAGRNAALSHLERELINGIPCTTVTQTLLDLAASDSPRLNLVKRSLAQLDYERKLDRKAIGIACGQGRRGSAKLLKALSTYMPQLARTKSDLEDEYLYLCQRFKIPLPEVNTCVYGEEVDCHWPDLGLAVELDGGRNHSSARNATATSARPSGCGRTD